MKILKTNNGNYFVADFAKNLFGFFCPEGRLLRQASEDEWRWAIGVMPEINSREIFFDFTFLEEVQSKRAYEAQAQREERLREISSQAGIELGLLQKIMEEIGINAEDFAFRGKMSIGWLESVTSTSGCAYTDRAQYKVFAILPEGKIEKTENELISLNAGINANGSPAHAFGYTARHLKEQYPKAKYFVVEFEYFRHVEHSRNTEHDEGISWSLFGAPSDEEMKELLKNEEKAVLEQLKKLEFPEEGFNSFLEKFPSSIPEDGGLLARDSSFQNHSESNDFGHESREFSLWFINCKGNIVALDPEYIGSKCVGRNTTYQQSTALYLIPEVEEAKFMLVEEKYEHNFEGCAVSDDYLLKLYRVESMEEFHQRKMANILESFEKVGYVPTSKILKFVGYEDFSLERRNSHTVIPGYGPNVETNAWGVAKNGVFYKLNNKKYLFWDGENFLFNNHIEKMFDVVIFSSYEERWNGEIFSERRVIVI